MHFRNFHVVFIWFLVLCSVKFFGANFLNDSILNYARVLSVLMVIIFSLPFFFPHRTGFTLPVQLMCFSIFTSMIVASLTWGQSIKDTFFATVPLFLWPAFFYLNKIKVKVATLETLIVILGVIYAVIFFYQYSNPESMVFGRPNWGDEFQEDRGIIRIIPPGSALFFLAVFIAINRLTTKGIKYRGLWLLLAILGAIVPVMQVTRITILGVVIIYSFHFFRGSLLRKGLTFICCSLLVVFLMSSEVKPITGMLAEQKENINAGNQYIRVLSGTYFLTEFSPMFVNQVLGNGVAYLGVSKYGKLVSDLNIFYGYYLEDLGIISVYVMFGVLGVVAYLLIWIGSFRMGIPQEYLYVKYYLWFLLINSLTTGNLYISDHLIVTVLALYIYHSVYVNEQSLTDLVNSLRKTHEPLVPSLQK